MSQDRIFDFEHFKVALLADAKRPHEFRVEFSKTGTTWAPSQSDVWIQHTMRLLEQVWAYNHLSPPKNFVTKNEGDSLVFYYTIDLAQNAPQAISYLKPAREIMAGLKDRVERDKKAGLEVNYLTLAAAAAKAHEQDEKPKPVAHSSMDTDDGYPDGKFEGKNSGFKAGSEGGVDHYENVHVFPFGPLTINVHPQLNDYGGYFVEFTYNKKAPGAAIAGGGEKAIWDVVDKHLIDNSGHLSEHIGVGLAEITHGPDAGKYNLTGMDSLHGIRLNEQEMQRLLKLLLEKLTELSKQYRYNAKIVHPEMTASEVLAYCTSKWKLEHEQSKQELAAAGQLTDKNPKIPGEEKLLKLYDLLEGKVKNWCDKAAGEGVALPYDSLVEVMWEAAVFAMANQKATKSEISEKIIGHLDLLEGDKRNMDIPPNIATELAREGSNIIFDFIGARGR